jgi:hypothetical protein
VPAAAVIPAPIACAKVVAVKKLVVELLAVCRPGFSRLEAQSSVCEPSSAFTGATREVDNLP